MRNVAGTDWPHWYAEHRVLPYLRGAVDAGHDPPRRGGRGRAGLRAAAGAGGARRTARPAARRPVERQRAVGRRRRRLADRPGRARRAPGDRPGDAPPLRLPAPGRRPRRLPAGGAARRRVARPDRRCTSCSRCWCTPCSSAAATPNRPSRWREEPWREVGGPVGSERRVPPARARTSTVPYAYQPRAACSRWSRTRVTCGLAKAPGRTPPCTAPAATVQQPWVRTRAVLCGRSSSGGPVLRCSGQEPLRCRERTSHGVGRSTIGRVFRPMPGGRRPS